MDQKTARHARRLWLHYGVFWSGAIAVGLLAVLYAWLIDFGYSLFRAGFDRHPWLALIVTPAVGALCVALTRRFLRGAQGSGIAQVVATLHGDTAALGGAPAHSPATGWQGARVVRCNVGRLHDQTRRTDRSGWRRADVQPAPRDGAYAPAMRGPRASRRTTCTIKAAESRS